MKRVEGVTIGGSAVPHKVWTFLFSLLRSYSGTPSRTTAEENKKILSEALTKAGKKFVSDIYIGAHYESFFALSHHNEVWMYSAWKKLTGCDGPRASCHHSGLVIPAFLFLFYLRLVKQYSNRPCRVMSGFLNVSPRPHPFLYCSSCKTWKLMKTTKRKKCLFLLFLFFLVTQQAIWSRL